MTITNKELTRVLKPSPNINFMTMCANFLAEIKQAQADGECDYEIAARHTRDGRPYVIRF